MSTETNLVLGDIVIPVGAGRGITQTLQPIDNGDLRRTINGELLNLTRTQNQKFESQITAADQSSPTFSGLWKGDVISVECIQNLRQHLLIPALNITLIRDPVAGSIIGRDIDGNKVAISTVVDRDITFVSNIKYVEFRPILSMMIVAVSFDSDEYAADESWSIDLEEV